jgi:hypothetical protein
MVEIFCAPYEQGRGGESSLKGNVLRNIVWNLLIYRVPSKLSIVLVNLCSLISPKFELKSSQKILLQPCQLPMPHDSAPPYLMTYARDISFYPILQFHMTVTYPEDARDFFLIDFSPSPNNILLSKLRYSMVRPDFFNTGWWVSVQEPNGVISGGSTSWFQEFSTSQHAHASFEAYFTKTDTNTDLTTATYVFIFNDPFLIFFSRIVQRYDVENVFHAFDPCTVH